MKSKLIPITGLFLTITSATTSFAGFNGGQTHPAPDGGSSFWLLGMAFVGLAIAAKKRFGK